MKKIIIIFCFILIPCFAKATTTTLADCAQNTVSNAITAASDGDIIACPSGTWDWASSVSLNKMIELKGAGIGNTIINMTTTSSSLVTSGTKTFRIDGFSFDGKSVSHASGVIAVQSTGAGWRIDHNKLINAGRGIGVGADSLDQTPGLIDHNYFLLDDPNGITIQGITIFGAARYPQVAAARKVNFMAYMGTSNAVYIEDNTFDFNWRSDGAIDTGGAARFVFRHNLVKGTAIGNHGTDSGNRMGMEFYEIYENTFTGKATGLHPNAVLYQSRSGTGVIYNNYISGDFQAYTFYFINYRDNSTQSWGGACDGTNWKMNFTNSLSTTGTYSFCSVTKDQYCTGDGDCPGGETCTSYFDGTGTAGYPCHAQVGIGPNQTSEPVYVWNNVRTDAGNALIVPYVDPGSADHIQVGRDVIAEISRPGYSSYTYPHPLTGESVSLSPGMIRYRKP